MKVGKRLGVIWVWAACFSLACSEKPEGSNAALYGVGNLVSVGDLVFVLSTDHNELRAFSLTSSERIRGPHFVPAVNPLEPLSIPVLTYPNVLASDLHWEDEVLESGERIFQARLVGGPFVYVASHGRGGISIVGGSAGWLKEVKYFPTEAPVTAMAGYRGEQLSTLFFATYDGTEGSLWALDLPSEQVVFETPLENLSARRIQSYPSEVVTALSVLPKGALAVAVRKTGSTTAALYFSDETQSTWRTAAPTQALRMLATHAAAKHADSPGGVLPAGKWLYALLDEGVCGAGPCEGGIIAIDTETGDVAKTISSTGGRLIAMGFMPDVVQARETLVGIYATGSGRIGMFDAAMPGPLEAAKAVSAAFFSPNEAGELVAADYIEGPLRNEDGTPVVRVARGAVSDEAIWIGAEALLPGWQGLSTTDSDGNRFPTDKADVSRAQVGDVLEVFDGGGLCAELTVSEVDEAPPALVTEEGFSACSDRTHFNLRAGQKSANPYVVVGTQTGYIGRASSGKTFEYMGSASEPILTIEFGDASTQVPRGSRWELVLTSGYLSSDIQSFSECSTQIAAGIWIDLLRKKAYVSFSSSNALVEMDIHAWIERGLGEAEVACYR